jgi:murein DD-endopeptidase MepM/ murein hydrolase activator NlpD
LALRSKVGYRTDFGRVFKVAESRPAGTRPGYTFAYAGHQIRLGPVAFWIVIGSVVVMACWSLATGTYFAFHEDVLTRLIARQKEQQIAYEDRIAELRAQVDRIASRQLLDQEQFEQRLEQIVRRQTTLESRASSLSGLPDPAPTGSIRSRPAPLPEPGISGAGTPKPSPISDTVIFSPPPDREARLESRVPPVTLTRVASMDRPASTATGIEGTLARLQASLDRVEARQTATLNSLEAVYDSKSKRIRGVLADLGLDDKKTAAPLPATGGPFVPVTLRKEAGAFERQLYRVSVARANFDKLNRVLFAVPVRKPISGEADLSSGFGVRMDPFLRSPAMHSGLDFRSQTGDAVRATGNGRVESAAWNGGYGKMVEIDHGNGFSTRYAHLSEIEVKVGQWVKSGQTIGRVGSTGRSTGPHLHYETRIDGEAVDPQKFLRAGLRLGNAL